MGFLKRRRIIAAFTVMCLTLSVTQASVSAHDPSHEPSEALKGRLYDGHVDDVSPGGVPMEPISNAPCIDGLSADLFECENVDLMSFIPLPGLESTFVNDVWGWTDSRTKMEIAIVGTFEGTAFVDVTDGYNPVFLGLLESAAPGDFGNIWGDIRVFENTAYIGAEAIGEDFEGFGVQIVDLTQFRGASGPIDIELSGHIDDFTNSHNLSLNVDSGRLYVVGSVWAREVCQSEAPEGDPFQNGDGSAIVYDLNDDPLNPEFVGCLDADGYTHDIQCVNYRGPDKDYRGAEICIGANEDSIAIYDATDPSNAELINNVVYQPFEFFNPEIGAPNFYTHQGWLSEKQDIFFLNDELDEFFSGTLRTTYIFDFSDLDNITLINGFSDGSTTIDHNHFVDRQRLYQSNYTDGLWIYDTWLADDGQLDLRGTFDVYPANDATDFAGTWGNYPYFAKDKVVVTSSDEGLFVLNTKAAQNRAGGKGKGNRK